MSTLRSPDQLKQRAHTILDDVRAGIHHDALAVTWALRILGEPVNA